MKEKIRNLLDRKITRVTRKAQLCIFYCEESGRPDSIAHSMENLDSDAAEEELDDFRHMGVKRYVAQFEDMGDDYFEDDDDYYGMVFPEYHVEFESGDDKTMHVMREDWYNLMDHYPELSKFHHVSPPNRAIMNLLYTHPMGDVDDYLEDRAH